MVRGWTGSGRVGDTVSRRKCSGGWSKGRPVEAELILELYNSVRRRSRPLGICVGTSVLCVLCVCQGMSLWTGSGTADRFQDTDAIRGGAVACKVSGASRHGADILTLCVSEKRHVRVQPHQVHLDRSYSG